MFTRQILSLIVLFVLKEVKVLHGLYACHGQLFAFPHPACAYTSSASSSAADSQLLSSRSTLSSPSIFFCHGMTFSFPHPACQYSSGGDSSLTKRQLTLGTAFLPSGGYPSVVIPGSPVTSTTTVNPVAVAIARCLAQGDIPEAGCTFTTGQIQADGTATCGQTCEAGPF